MNNFALPETIFFCSTYIGVVCWDVIFFQTRNFAYPYRQVFAIFSVFQWIAITTGMVAIFGGWVGILSGLAVMTLGLPVVSLLGGRPLKLWLLDNYKGITAIFASNVWCLVFLSVYLLYFR